MKWVLFHGQKSIISVNFIHERVVDSQKGEKTYSFAPPEAFHDQK